ncbi:hypothetical protein CHS0354_038321 [Potamilus streckersoni]|uniref:Hyaluronan/mRNA-binding protein domain-containing protein n=1 Tax=Potamilus streckersoni TaxID=2493646 RepID=A0AAE0S6M4_9BIVA|nr:hypothetical protein CHS0354_038321 [Potamilus streckersoni]
MENHYGVQITNKFNIFLDEDLDPIEILQQQEEATKRKKEETKKEAEKTKGKNKSTKKSASQDAKPKPAEIIVPKKEEKLAAPKLVSEKERDRDSRDRPRTGRDRPPREPREPREQREPREPREENDRRPPRRREDNNEANRERNEGGFGGFAKGDRPERSEGGFGGRGRGGPRSRGGRGRGRGGFGGKREFERHSGSDKTGVKAVDKKEGSGAHNWGTVKDDLEMPKMDYWRNPKEQLKDVEESPDWNAHAEDTENQDPNESAESAPVEEDAAPKQMTLDEWKKMQEKNRMKSRFNIRRPGEGEDNPQWKKGHEYRKSELEEDDEEENEEDEAEEEVDEEEEEEEDRNKQIINNIKFTFSDSPRRGRGGRRPRGPRGGMGGRGSGRGDRKAKEVAPRFDDEKDFPRLVKTEA